MSSAPLSRFAPARAPQPDPRLATPDGGPPLGPDEHIETPTTYSFDYIVRGLSPLHHAPVDGTIYRALTAFGYGETNSVTVCGSGAAARPVERWPPKPDYAGQWQK